MQVFVRDNNVDRALKVLKRKMQREGVFREMGARPTKNCPSARPAKKPKPSDGRERPPGSSHSAKA